MKKLRFKIVEHLVWDIFGQYSAEYLSDHKFSVKVSDGEGSNRITELTLSKGTIVTLDFMRLSFNHFNPNFEFEVDNYVLANYAKNPAKGIVCIITGAISLVTVVKK